MSGNYLKIITVILVCYLLCSCSKDSVVKPVNTNNTIDITRGSKIILGDRFENPYKLENVIAAYESLTKSGRLAGSLDLTPTHWYVRFLPDDLEAFDLLRANSSLILYDHPLDFDFEVEGNWYHDPELPDTAITWQYTVVPYEGELPDIKYEILDELYMPEDMQDGEGSSNGRITASLWDQIEEEAFRITGNEDDLISQESKIGRIERSRYNPGGRILVETRDWDWLNARSTSTGVQPLQETQVKVRYATRTRRTTTDRDGRFRISDRYRSRVHYGVEFETRGYRVTNWLGWSRNYNRAGRTSGQWNTTLNYSDKEYEVWV